MRQTRQTIRLLRWKQRAQVGRQPAGLVAWLAGCCPGYIRSGLPGLTGLLVLTCMPFVCCPSAADGALSPPPVVGLSDSQLLSAQQMARHLSQVMVLHSSGEASGGGGGSSSVHGSRHGGEPLSPLEESSLERRHDDGEAGGDGNGVAVAAPAADGANKPSLGASTLAGAGTTSGERRDWVLAKLQALVDAVQQLEAASLREREEHQIGEGQAALCAENTAFGAACWPQAAAGVSGLRLWVPGVPGGWKLVPRVSWYRRMPPRLPVPARCSRPALLPAADARGRQPHAPVRRLLHRTGP